MNYMQKSLRNRKIVDEYVLDQIDIEKFNLPQMIRTELEINFWSLVYYFKYLAPVEITTRTVPIVVGKARIEAWKKVFPTLSERI